MSNVWIGSPNHWNGRQLTKIDRIVIHWMDGTLAATDQVFQDTSRQTSAHYGIENTTIHQYVKESDAAWHSGDGNMNLRSIGIEHSATPERQATASTIETSSKLVADICKRYSIPCDRKHVIKHSEVPYATECPGTIPIDQIVIKANSILKGGNMTSQEQHDVGTAVYRATLHREPESGSAAIAMGKRLEDKDGNLTPKSIIAGLATIPRSSEWKGQNEKIQSKVSSTTAVKLDKSVVLDYVTKNLK